MRARSVVVGLGWAVVCSLLAWKPVRAAELVTLDSWQVVAWPALILRAQPAADGEALARVPYGESVAVVTSATSGSPQVVSGAPGRWRQVHWGVQRGWMFDAWLLPLPAPPSSCAGVEDWAARWNPEGPELTEWLEGDDPSQPFPRRIRHFEGGMKWAVPELEGGPEGELWLPALSLPQAWFAARRCHGGIASMAAQGWPPTGSAGLRVHRTGEELTVRDVGGRTLLAIEQEPGGVWLSWW